MITLRKGMYLSGWLLLMVAILTGIGHHQRVLAADKAPVLAIYAPLAGVESEYRALIDRLQLAANANPAVAVEALIEVKIDDVETALLFTFSAETEPTIINYGQQSFGDGRLLTLFVEHVYAAHPQRPVMLVLEGHGGGYLPDAYETPNEHTVDITQPIRARTVANLPLAKDDLIPVDPIIIGAGTETHLPYLPMTSTILPGNMMPTYELGEALRAATRDGARKLAVVHFNNCFNFSAELLDTISPYADYAIGYPNYNFYTSGSSYEAVLQQIDSDTSSAEMAILFAEANQHELSKHAGHPTIGSAISLANFAAVRDALDGVADALISALSSERATIEQAIGSAQKYDTSSCESSHSGDFALTEEDSLTDLRDFARALTLYFPAAGPDSIGSQAQQLYDALDNVKVYGSTGTPWMAQQMQWDFSSEHLSMNIFLPRLRSINGANYADWRMAYYVTPYPEQSRLPLLEETDWDEFIYQFYRGQPLHGLTACSPTYADAAQPIE